MAFAEAGDERAAAHGNLEVHTLECVHHEIVYPWALERIGAALADRIRPRPVEDAS